VREVLFGLPEVIGDERLIRKVRYGKEMIVRDLDPQTLPPFEEGQWLKMSSPEEGLVAILQSALRGGEIGKADPDRVALRPIRVFQPSPLPTGPGPDRGRGRQAIPLPIGGEGEGEGKDPI
jgi:hypothetical protein